MKGLKPINNKPSVICVNKAGELCIPIGNHHLVIDGIGQWEKHKILPILDRFYFTKKEIKRL